VYKNTLCLKKKKTWVILQADKVENLHSLNILENSFKGKQNKSQMP
jgi:hypothetical protein